MSDHPLPLSRRDRRAYARQAPPRVCGICGANLAKVFDATSHIARHVEDRSGIHRRLARKVIVARGGI